MPTGQLEEACRLYYLTDEAYEALNDERKKFSAQLDFMSRQVIPDIMAERKVSSISLADLSRRFTKSVRVTATMLDPDAAIKWLNDNGKGDMVKATVNASSFGVFIREYVEENQVDPPDFVKMNTVATISVTKINVKE